MNIEILAYHRAIYFLMEKKQFTKIEAFNEVLKEKKIETLDFHKGEEHLYIKASKLNSRELIDLFYLIENIELECELTAFALPNSESITEWKAKNKIKISEVSEFNLLITVPFIHVFNKK